MNFSAASLRGIAAVIRNAHEVSVCVAFTAHTSLLRVSASD